MADKKKLREIYRSIATPEEIQSLENDEKLSETNAASLAVEQKVADVVRSVEEMGKTQSEIHRAVESQKLHIPKLSAKVVEAFSVSSDAVVKKLDEVMAALGKGKGDSTDALLRDLGKKLSEWHGSTKKFSELIQTLKWNSVLSLRNSSGSPIDPATDGIGIGSWNSVTPSYPDSVTEVYPFMSGTQLKATVTIVYTDATKQVLQSVTRA